MAAADPGKNAAGGVDLTTCDREPIRDKQLLLEFEPASLDVLAGRQVPYDVGNVLERLEAAGSWRDLCHAAAVEVRRLTGFDKVMVYQFDAGWNGLVVAEDQVGGMDPYLGLRFPASDIPAQARELYRVSPIRLIPDAGYTASPIVPAAGAADVAPLDLSFAVLRSVSPVHLEYLRNMGVAASMSVSILRDGRLWGLIACHHRTARRVPHERRLACEFVGEAFAMLLAGRELQDGHARRAAARARVDGVVARLRSAEQLAPALNESPEELLRIADADGVAICGEDRCVSHGRTPDADQVRGIVAWLAADADRTTYSSDWFPGECGAAAGLGDSAAGVLAIRFSRVHQDYVIWFRREQQRDVEWAGRPDKPATGDGRRLHPRESFATWVQRVGGRSRPWGAAEIDAAAGLRDALVDLALRKSEESAARAKDQFMAILSHELRTPLSPVLTAVTALQADASLSRDTQELLHVIRRNVEVETRLIDDLLDLTRIGKGKLSLNTEPLDLHAVIDRAIEVCENEIQEKGIRLTRKPSAQGRHVNGDPARLQQVFWNLLRNAGKFTPPGGSVEVVTSNPVPGQVRVEVRDTGMGIEPEVLPHVFEAYEQGSRSVTRRFGGLGLGLSISRTLVELHGGRLSVASEGKGRGATFTVELPATKGGPGRTGASRAGADAAHAGPTAASPLQILLVEDHKDTARVMARLLAQLHYNVRTADTIAAARAMIAAHEFDLMICDLGLPDGNGADLMREVRERSTMPAIALSGYGMEDDVRRSREAGFDRHLVKPVNFQLLHETIRQTTAAG
jgi:light-regulated signal transduction histidine kinase (bacteriophytochrome)/CheY-like chemotaxis protein